MDRGRLTPTLSRKVGMNQARCVRYLRKTETRSQLKSRRCYELSVQPKVVLPREILNPYRHGRLHLGLHLLRARRPPSIRCAAENFKEMDDLPPPSLHSRVGILK